MSAKPTPGPWTSDRQDGLPGHCLMAQVWGPDGRSLASIDPTEDPSEADANARLIAAAPDLLAFAKAYAETWVAAGGMPLDDEALRDMARAAIRLAETGERS